MVGWAGEWCVGVQWDVFVLENVAVELCKFVKWYVNGAVVFLVEHVPELFWFIF